MPVGLVATLRLAGKMPASPTGWKPEDESYSLDTLLWRYGEMFTADEQQNIIDADAMLDEIKAALDMLGIDSDFGFTPTFNRSRETPRSLQEYLESHS